MWLSPSSSFLSFTNYFFKISFLGGKNQEYHHCQTVWIQINPGVLSRLIWVQNVSKGYQQEANSMCTYQKGIQSLFQPLACWAQAQISKIF